MTAALPMFCSARLKAMMLSLIGVLMFAAVLPSAGQAAAAGDEMISVIVRMVGGSSATEPIEEAGGHVTGRLEIINGYKAEVPASEVGSIRRARGVHSVTENAKVKLLGFAPEYDAGNDMGSLYNLTRAIQAPEMWKKGFTGKGIGVALIDSGVLPVEGLDAAGKVVNGPDLSFESQYDNLRYLDSYGHGTHMAGIIGGRDTSVPRFNEDTKDGFVGVAPDARIVSIKVADAEGATDVSQVIAAIDWVVQHRNDDGMNIKVLNLSFGTDGVQSYVLDPLSYAAEVAWHKGITVVVAGGNSGYGSKKLNNPAYNPFVIAVGAVKANGTPDTKDDTVPEWSSSGDGARNPDVVAPGQSVSSLRAPGSLIDTTNPQAVLHDRMFKGSGTSQSAAAVSGAAALLLQQRPNMTPDQVKRILIKTASPLPNADPVAQGAGIINLKSALTPSFSSYTLLASAQPYLRSTGLGSLDEARSTARMADEGIELRGEIDIMGTPWDATTWAKNALGEATWNGGLWNGTEWSGDGWTGISWTGRTWSGRT